MKKKLGDITFREVMEICEKRRQCYDSEHPCPFNVLGTIANSDCPLRRFNIRDSLKQNMNIVEFEMDENEPEQENGRWRPFNNVKEFVKEFKLRFNSIVNPNYMPSIWLRERNGSAVKIVQSFNKADNTVFIQPDGNIDMKSLFDNYTFMNGSLCGIKKEC